MILSIIIPVHNCEEYLNECLESCFDQDVSSDSFQVICVDDGSTDNSQRILSHYKKQHNNFLWFYQEQGGVSKARNQGLKKAQGDYVWFVDADDFIENCVLNDIFTILMNSNCDRLKVSSYCFFDTLSSEEKKKRNQRELISNYPYKDTQITRTVLRRSYIEKHGILFYEDLFYGEDTLFNFETRFYNPVDLRFNKVVYYYRKHLNASTNFNSENKKLLYFVSSYRAIQKVNHYYKKRTFYSETRLMLIYWLEIFLDLGGQLNTKQIKEVIDNNGKNTIEVNKLDLKLSRLNRIYTKAIIYSQYDVLRKYHKQCEKRKMKKINNQIRKKRICGYLKHPKRLFMIN